MSQTRDKKRKLPSPFVLPVAVVNTTTNPNSNSPVAMDTAQSALPAPALPVEEKKPAKKVKKRKRRKLEDQTWTKRGTGRPGSAFNFRHHHKGVVAYLVDRTKLGDMTPEERAKVEFAMAEKLAKEQKVEFVEEVTEWNKGIPVTVKKESGEPGYLASTNGIVLAFHSSPQADKSPGRPKKTELTEEEQKQIFASSPFQAVQSNEEEIIPFEFHVTAEQLRKAKKEFEKNNFKRVPDQNTVVVKENVPAKKGSATNYGQLFIDIICEWGHKVAHSKKGNAAQEINNLGCLSFPANTNMMHVEMQDETLLEDNPDGYWIRGVAHYIPKTKMFTYLEYTIETGNVNLPFTFNCQDKKNPNAANLQCVKAVMKVTIDWKKNNLLTPPQHAKSHMVLFTPKIPGKAPAKDLTAEMDEASDNSLSQLSTSSNSSAELLNAEPEIRLEDLAADDMNPAFRKLF
jgi:hypothetical protein